MRTPYIAGNWKMNTTEDEAVTLARAVAQLADDTMDADIGICVPFPHLGPVRDATAESRVIVGAQDVHWEPKGAFTGEVSTSMIADYGRAVIIGHSERRQYFGETDEIVNRKLVAVLDSSLDPILCIGETLQERQAGDTESVLSRQISEGLKGISVTRRITIAYEPVWAIGTGETATPDVAQAACAFIRRELAALGGEEADWVRIQYGGSMNAVNAAELLQQPDIDGGLVGGASLDPAQFAQVIAALPR